LTEVPDVKLQPFNPPEHLPLLDGWLRKPHVQRWWGIAEVALAGALERPARSGHAIITLGDTPLGYICWQPIQQEDRREIAWEAMPDGTFDMDILIGDKQYLGRGIGPQAIRLLLRTLASDSSLDLLGLSASIANHAAISAYQKVGFTLVKEYESSQWGHCVFMAVRPHDAAA
jgi:aminoglycoside 6'-N-acetyltransferase